MPLASIVRFAARHLWLSSLTLLCLAFPRIPEALPASLLLLLFASGMGLDYATYVRRPSPPSKAPGRASTFLQHLRPFFLEYPDPARLGKPQWLLLGMAVLVVGFFTLYGNTVRGLYLLQERISRHAGMGIPGFLFNQEAALATLQAKAEQGDPAAMFFMIMDRRQPDDKAVESEWLRKSAEQGYPAAHNILGTRYMRGKTVPRDCRKALHHLTEYIRTLHSSPKYEGDAFLTWGEKAALRHIRSLSRECGQDRRAERREDEPTAH